MAKAEAKDEMDKLEQFVVSDSDTDYEESVAEASGGPAHQTDC